MLQVIVHVKHTSKSSNKLTPPRNKHCTLSRHRNCPSKIYRKGKFTPPREPSAARRTRYKATSHFPREPSVARWTRSTVCREPHRERAARWTRYTAVLVIETVISHVTAPNATHTHNQASQAFYLAATVAGSLDRCDQTPPVSSHTYEL